MDKKQVLIVDDSFDLTRVLRSAIETLEVPLDVKVVPSAEEAMLEITKGLLDLIITDIRLPGISGLEMVPKIRKINKSVNIMMMTGLTDISLEDDARKVGVNFFLRKPIELSLFLDAVTSFLGVHAPEEQEEISKISLDIPFSTGEDIDKEAPNFSRTLSTLRQEVNASVIWVLDENGRVVVQSGDSQNIKFEERWAPLLMPVLSTAEKFTNAFYYKESPQTLTTFRMDNIDLLLLPVGDYALVILLNKGRGNLRLPAAIENVLSVQKDLTATLKDMGVLPTLEISDAIKAKTQDLHPEELFEEEVEENVVDEELMAFESLFDNEPQSEDIDSFWEVATLEQAYDLKNSDDLTYDQASKLGLTPKEENDE